MNRRKKAKQIFDKKKRREQAKTTIKQKPKYISKAERERLAAEQGTTES